MQDIPLSEFDYDKRALIEPAIHRRSELALPEHCILTFYNSVIQNLSSSGAIIKLQLFQLLSSRLMFFYLITMVPKLQLFTRGCALLL